MRYCSARKMLFIGGWERSSGSSGRKNGFLFPTVPQGGDGGFNPSHGSALLSGHGLSLWGHPSRRCRSPGVGSRFPPPWGSAARLAAPAGWRQRPLPTAATASMGARGHIPAASEAGGDAQPVYEGCGGGCVHEWRFSPAAV